jgi:hypothetical protein
MQMLRTMSVAALLAVAGSCAVSHVMPPFSATRSYASASVPPTALSLPTARVFQHHKRISREYDPVTDQTRVSVTTHRGTHFLWIRRPRLTFFYVYSGAGTTQAPASVFLIFRTQDPQLPSSNRLTLSCNGVRDELAVTPVSWLEPGVMTSSRHYMYQLPLATFATFLTCSQPAISLGDVNAPFADDQLEALRDFATGLRSQ